MKVKRQYIFLFRRQFTYFGISTIKVIFNCFLYFISATLLSCNQTDSIALQSVFKDWFIDTSNKNLPLLLKLKQTEIDSILQKARIYGSIQSRKNCIRLVDTSGIEYLSGFQTPSFIHPDSLYPLIIYLHGGTGTQLNNKGEKAFEMLSPMADSMPLFLASPSASRNAQWWTPTGLSRIMQTLRFMTYTYPVDPSKVFLVGVSDGATGCYSVANTLPYPFAGFIAISGYGGLLGSLGINLYPDNIRQRPIYNINASDDRLYSLGDINSFLDYLENHGVSITKKIYTGEKHGFDYRDKEFPTLISIIKLWRRPHFTSSKWCFVKNFPNSPADCINWTFPKNLQNASVSTYPSGDTIIVNLQDIQKLVLHIPGQYHKKHVKVNSKRVFSVSESSNQQKYKLQFMKYTCNPKEVSGIFMTIKN